MLKRLLQPGHGHRDPDDRGLALNLSFVLHERSDSPAVQNAVRATQSHLQGLRWIDPALGVPATASDFDPTGVTIWLTATIGIPQLLAAALGTSSEQVIAVDTGMSPILPIQFFRAPAHLSLPVAGEVRVGVAALILRPDRRTSHLAVSGVHDWPADRDATIRSLERLTQAYAGQWMPTRPLWPDPAESLLASEVY